MRMYTERGRDVFVRRQFKNSKGTCSFPLLRRSDTDLLQAEDTADGVIICRGEGSDLSPAISRISVFAILTLIRSLTRPQLAPHKLQALIMQHSLQPRRRASAMAAFDSASAMTFDPHTDLLIDLWAFPAYAPIRSTHTEFS